MGVHMVTVSPRGSNIPKTVDETERRIMSMLEARLRAEFRAELNRKLEEQRSRMQEEMQQFKLEVMTQVEAVLAQRQSRSYEPTSPRGRPRKKQMTGSKKMMTEDRCNGNTCSVCGEQGRDVHRHRDLGLHLDGKCRKQVDTFKHGGRIQERRKEWASALLEIGAHSELSRKMLASLGRLPTEASDEDREASCSMSGSGSPPASFGLSPEQAERVCVKTEHEEHERTVGSLCIICRDVISAQQVSVKTACQHRFHQDCLHTWLQKASSCPVCKHDFNEDYGHTTTMPIEIKPTNTSADESVEMDENVEMGVPGVETWALRCSANMGRTASEDIAAWALDEDGMMRTLSDDMMALVSHN